MSHYVPDFEIDDDYALPSSSSLTRSKKSAMIEEDIMELLWQNGQVVTQSQNQRSMLKKPQTPLPTSTSSPPSKYDQDAVISADHRQSTTREIQQQHLFMQEDEMASWLHYPLNDTNFDDHDDFCGGLLYPPPSSTSAAASTTTALVSETHSRAATQNLEVRPVMLPSVTAAAMRPPVPPPRRAEAVPNFPLFSRHRGRGGIAASEPGPSSNNISNNTNYTPNNFRSPVVGRESTVVDSSVTPAVCCSVSRVSEAAARSSTLGASSGDHGRGTISGGAATNNTANRDTPTTCEVTVTSSPGGSSASASAEQPPPAPQHHPPVAGGIQAPVPEDRKRKGRDDDSECHSEDAEFESANAKKQQRGSSSTKRSRAAEVHNLSERRRRDRINEKMKALQELIPRCNKSDKASMLDEAIEYLKSLQLQVQMMSMGCGMVPMMFPGVQQYMSPMGMGLGVGMPMEMGMNRPVLPFPNVLAGASLSTPATAAHLGPRFQMPAFHLPSVPSPDPSRIQGANLRDPILNSLGVQNPNPLRVPTFADPYQQYLGLHQMQIPIAQNQASTNPSNSKPSTSRGVDHQDNNQPGGT